MVIPHLLCKIFPDHFQNCHSPELAETCKTLRHRQGTGNIEWDGKNQQDEEVPDGVYSLVLKVQGRDGKEWEQRSHITLVR